MYNISLLIVNSRLIKDRIDAQIVILISWSSASFSEPIEKGITSS